MSLRQRFDEVLKLTPNHMAPELAAQFRAMLTPSSMAMIAAAFTALAVSQAFGIGEIVDLILLLVGAFFVGMAVFTAAEDIYECVKTTVRAKTPADLDRAADYLAQAIAILGVVVFFALIAKIGEKFKGAGSGEEGSPGASAEGGSGDSAGKPIPTKPRESAPAKADGAPHNKDWRKIDQDVKTQFGAQRREGPVDMGDLSDEDAATYDRLRQMGRGEGDRPQTILNSGTKFTDKPLAKDSPLYAFESSDGTKKPNSPFWLDKEGFKDVKDKFYKDGEWDRQGVKGYLALPCVNRADSIVEAKVTTSQTALESTIGPATENYSYVGADGEIQQQSLSLLGGGRQITPAVDTVQLVTP